MIEGIWETAAFSLQPAIITLSKKVSQYPHTSLVPIACNSSNLICTSFQR